MDAFPVTFDEAAAFVDKNHRHHDPPVRVRFVVGAEKDGRLVGVAMVGRPVAKALNWRVVAEVNRCCTDGTRNACSFLYARCVTIARAMGYNALITYTLDEESGASLRAAGWWGERTAVDERSWNSPSRPRDTPSLGPKTRWVYLLREWQDVPDLGLEAAPSPQQSLFADTALHRKAT